MPARGRAPSESGRAKRERPARPNPQHVAGVGDEREGIGEESRDCLHNHEGSRDQEARDQGPARLLRVCVHHPMLAERANATVYVRANAELPG